MVKYFKEVAEKGQIPKGFGMIHRKNLPNEMNAGNVSLTDQHSDAIANSLNQARYVNKLLFNNVNLKDEQAINIIRKMDRQTVRHLDISYNPNLTKAFYMELCEILRDPNSHLERLEIEGNYIGDTVLHELVKAMCQTKKIVYLNVSKNRIEDTGARDIATLIRDCPTLRLLFVHYNRILGFGGVEIADAI